MQTVVLRTFDDYFTANILLTKLQDAGISCYLFDENTVTVTPYLGGVVGGIKLVAKQEDEATARELMQRFDEEYKQAVVCPKCLGNDILLLPAQNPENFFTAIITWLFGNYAISKRVYTCQQCGYKTDALPAKEPVFE